MKKNVKYLAKIYWSEEDGCYVAEVPALPGCVSHGDTFVKAARNIREAMEVWLESAHRHDDPIPEPDLAAEEIGRLLPLLNVSKLARLSGVNKSTLASKLRRKSGFTVEEARKIRSALASV
jgi:predicted RNase H-like HicB family nuclease